MKIMLALLLALSMVPVVHAEDLQGLDFSQLADFGLTQFDDDQYEDSELNAEYQDRRDPRRRRRRRDRRRRRRRGSFGVHICYAYDRAGNRYQGENIFRDRARWEAVTKCEERSYRPRSCYFDSCTRFGVL